MKTNELKSLNEKIYSKISIEELEERLEMGCWSEGGGCEGECNTQTEICACLNVFISDPCPSNTGE